MLRTSCRRGLQPAQRDEHVRRAAALQHLKPRERRELYLHAAGYSYQEIATLTDSGDYLIGTEAAMRGVVTLEGRSGTAAAPPEVVTVVRSSRGWELREQC